VTSSLLFNPFVPSFKRNPYLQYGRLREGDPIHRSEALQAWVLTRYADCVEVIRDHETFSSESRHARGQLADAIAQQRATSPLPGAETILGLDPPRHRQMRALVDRAFTPRRVQELRPHIEEIASTLLADAGDEFDLMTTLAQPLPVIVIAELLGVSPDDRLQFKDWSNALAETTNLMQTAELVERARLDLISALVQAEVDGAHLSREDVLAFAILLLVAGNETTTNLIGNGLAALIDAPASLARLRAEPDRIPDAVEEMLRYDSPVQGLARFVARDVDLTGVRLAAGDVVLCLIGAANRDPEAFPNPDRFDLDRTERRHLSFGQGVHYCLGAPLARLEADVVFRTLLGRYPSIEVGEGGVERGGTLLLRGPVRFPLRVTQT
jgi:cytochrome P450